MSAQSQTRAKAHSTSKSSLMSVQSQLLQRKCDCGGSPGVDGECEGCREKRLTMQRRAINPAMHPEIPPVVHDVLCSPGQQLDTKTRKFMEPRLGHDFSKVRIHTDAQAAESARSVNALAYTVGRDVVFGSGQYMPGTNEGQRLITHELTHVVQQGRSSTLGDKSILSPTDRYENEADSQAQNVLHGGTTISSPTRLGGLALQRQSIPGQGTAPVKSPTKSEELLKDDDAKFLMNVSKALAKSSQAVHDKDGEKEDLLRHMGWSLTFMFAGVVQGDVPRDFVSKVAEIWAIRLNMFSASSSDKTIDTLRDAILKLNTQDLKSIEASYPSARRPGPSQEPEKKEKPEKGQISEISEEKLREALAQLKEEDISRLDKVQEYWDKIADSNTQEVTSYVMDKVAERLEEHLPRISGSMSKLAKLWILKHVVTLFFDILNVRDGDKKSARRMMFLDPEETIELYNFLTREWPNSSDAKRRKVSVVTEGSSAHFESGEETTEIRGSDIITGLTVQKFSMLFLTNKEEAIKLAEVVGGYVWKNSPRMGTPAGREAVRRINEGIKLMRDVIDLLRNIYGKFNPVWEAMKSVIALGNILTTDKM